MQSVGYDGVVFAGGGCRCFWQAGFFATAREVMNLAPKKVAAASAGAALGCVSIAGLANEAVKVFKEKTAANPRNVYPQRVFSSKPVFPHTDLFREAIYETIDASALCTIQYGPEMRVALTRVRPSRTVGAAPRVVAGLLAYKLERRATGKVHGTWARRLGLHTEWVRADHSKSVEELADLLLHTSCSPPFTPAFQRNGARVLDGGLADNVPVLALKDCQRILVLLTRRFRKIPQNPRVDYVHPSQPVGIGSWDYTNPSAIQWAYDQGRRDGETFARRPVNVKKGKSFRTVGNLRY